VKVRWKMEYEELLKLFNKKSMETEGLDPITEEEFKEWIERKILEEFGSW